MKKLILFVLCSIGFITGRAHGIKDIKDFSVDCVSEIPTTSFFLTTQSDYLEVKVINHNGNLFAPIRSALVTPNDMELLQQEALIMKSLPSNLSFKFKITDCRFDKALLMSCVGEAKSEVNTKNPLAAWAFFSTAVTEKTIYGDFEHIALELKMKSGTQDIALAMKYQNGECARSPLTSTKH